MLIPSEDREGNNPHASLSRRVNANSQRQSSFVLVELKLIKKGEC